MTPTSEGTITRFPNGESLITQLAKIEIFEHRMYDLKKIIGDAK